MLSDDTLMRQSRFVTLARCRVLMIAVGNGGLTSGITKRMFRMEFFRKTLGGLSGYYYFRNFVFGALIAIVYKFILRQNPNGIPTGNYIFIAICILLYPYSRFVYETIIGFFIGDNIFFINAILMLIVKFFTMLLCFVFSIFIAPIGLVYLYFYHTKAAKQG